MALLKNQVLTETGIGWTTDIIFREYHFLNAETIDNNGYAVFGATHCHTHMQPIPVQGEQRDLSILRIYGFLVHLKEKLYMVVKG